MFQFLRTILLGCHLLPGNWEVARDKAKRINLIEPVVEGIIQLFFQTIILYIVFGPGITKYGGTPFDLSSLLYQAQIWKSKVFYGLVLTTTVISVGISFSRLLTQGKVPVIKRIISLKFLKVLLMLILKFIIHSYILAMAVMSLMYKFVSKDSFTLISFI